MNHQIFKSLLLIACVVAQLNAIDQDFASSSSTEIKKVQLKMPDLSDENIIGYGVGIRPYRESGIRLESMRVQNKFIVHNYGYGGSGLTLCWGGASEVMDLLQKEINLNPDFSSCKKVAVLGAGVIGLSTAYTLLEQGYQVTIYASEFSPYTTSNIAGGIWSPPTTPKNCSLETKSLYERITDISEKRFMKSISSESPEFQGISWMDIYSFKVMEPKIEVLAHNFQVIEKKETVEVTFDNGLVKIGKTCLGPAIDGRVFLADLSTKIQLKNVQIVERHFKTLDDVLGLDEDMIINCTSFGSRALFDDKEMKGVRGHIIYFKKPENVEYLLAQNVPNSNYWIVMHPWSDRLILGGVWEEGVEDCVLDQNVINTILENGRNFTNGITK